jgi:hypothetical protein
MGAFFSAVEVERCGFFYQVFCIYSRAGPGAGDMGVKNGWIWIVSGLSCFLYHQYMAPLLGVCSAVVVGYFGCASVL